MVDSDTGQLFTVKVGRDGNAARKIRELAVAGGPFKGGDGLLIDRGRLPGVRVDHDQLVGAPVAVTAMTVAVIAAASPPLSSRRRCR